LPEPDHDRIRQHDLVPAVPVIPPSTASAFTSDRLLIRRWQSVPTAQVDEVDLRQSLRTLCDVCHRAPEQAPVTDSICPIERFGQGSCTGRPLLDRGGQQTAGRAWLGA